MRTAETIESRRCTARSAADHPFAFTRRGRVTNVGAAIVVPTNAASIRSEAPPDGRIGFAARASVAASGHVTNAAKTNVRAISATKNERIFSKTEMCPIIRSAYMTPITGTAIATSGTFTRKTSASAPEERTRMPPRHVYCPRTTQMKSAAASPFPPGRKRLIACRDVSPVTAAIRP